MSQIQIDAFQETCEKALKEYRDVSMQSLKRAVDKTSTEVTKEIRTKAPVRKYGLRGGRYPPGSYAKDWTSKKDTDTSAKYSRTVYNRKHYALAHLLQHGHALRGYFQNRTSKTRVPAYPHIPSDEETERTFEKNLIQELNK